MQLEKTSIKSGAVVPMVAVLSNPKSSTNAAGLEKVRKLVRRSANVVHFELDGMDSIDEALGLFGRANPSLLVINGGDGTIGAVLSALLYKNPFSIVPPIAFLPGGKTNMTASDLGARGCPEKVLRRLLKIVQRGEIHHRLLTRNLIELDLGDGAAPRVGTFFGTAGVVKTIHWCRENAYAKGLPNWLAHIWTFTKLVPALLGFGRNKGLMISDNMSISVRGAGNCEGQFAFVVASTLDKLLMGMKPFAVDGFGGLKFSAISTGRKTMLAGIKGIIFGTYGSGKIPGISVARSDYIEILSKDPVTLDGEIYFPSPDHKMTLKGNKSLTFVGL